MRLLQVAEELDPVMGGVAEGVYQQSRLLVSGGWEVECFSGDASAVARFDAAGIPHHAFAPTNQGWRWSRELKPWLATNIQRFDAVVLNGVWSGPILEAGRAAQKAGVPTFLMPHGMMDPYFKSSLKKRLVKEVYWRLAAGSMIRKCRGLLFTTQAEQELAGQAYPVVDMRSWVVGYGISDPPAAPSEPPADLPESYDLFMSRIDPKKGLDLLIEAKSRLGSEWPEPLVICGRDEGAYADELKARCQELGLGDQVRWLGFTSGERKWQILSSARCMMLTSRQENFGVIVAEALAMGRPVLISRAVNIWREVEEDGAGWICNPDLKSVVEAIRGLKNPPTNEACRASFSRRFRMEDGVEKFRKAILEGLK